MTIRNRLRLPLPRLRLQMREDVECKHRLLSVCQVPPVQVERDDEADHVAWWRANVGEYQGRPRKNAGPRSFSVESAEELTGISQQQTSKWAAKVTSDEARAKRSEKAKQRPRKPDGTLASGGTTCSTTDSTRPKEHKARAAKAAKAGTNRGAVQRIHAADARSSAV